MRTTRIYHCGNIEINNTIDLDDQASRHIGLVLRVPLHHDIIVFNGDGYDYQGKIIEISKRFKSIKIFISQKTALQTESKLNIHLIQAISRSEKMDWVIQKAVELGVSEITPVKTNFGSVKLTDSKSERYKKIVISACEQSGRAKVPVVHESLPLQDLYELRKDKWSEEQNFVFDPTALKSLNAFKKQNEKINLLIGPEGGFSEMELLHAQQYYFNIVKLGNRILRTETAPICAISAIQTLWGDFY